MRHDFGQEVLRAALAARGVQVSLVLADARGRIFGEVETPLAADGHHVVLRPWGWAASLVVTLDEIAHATVAEVESHDELRAITARQREDFLKRSAGR